MSLLTDFYFKNKSIKLDNGKFYTLLDIIQQDDNWWENCHNHIQWIFPTFTKSEFNEDAPILTTEDISVFKHNDEKSTKIMTSKVRFLKFLENSDLSYFNHNFLRISRCLESLTLVDNNRLDAYKYLNSIFNNTNILSCDSYTLNNSLKYFFESFTKE